MKNALLVLLCIILFSNLYFSECAQFKIAYRDNREKKLKDYNKPTVKKSSKVQCAAYCLKNEGCDGFSLDSKNTCILLKGKITEGACPGSGCSKRKGYSVYKML